ncbi:hypothetical protein [Salirhabdus euzebyi]|nr:hypothetical protein [Salirhabdus euzebyi]
MKWIIYQILTLSIIVFFMWILDYINENRTIQHSSSEWTAVNSTFITFYIIAFIVSCFYLLFLFEAKKDNGLFDRSFWAVMPKMCVIIGVLSIILFLTGGTIGPIMVWIEQWPSLIYVFFIYFLFLIFLFIFSIEHKKHRYKQRKEKTVHISFTWTILLFFVLFFLI